MAGISLHSAHRQSVRVETPSHFDTAAVLRRGSRIEDFSIGLSLLVECQVCPAIQLPRCRIVPALTTAYVARNHAVTAEGPTRFPALANTRRRRRGESGNSPGRSRSATANP